MSLGGGDSMCKGPEAGESLSLLRMWMSLSDIGAEWLHFLLLGVSREEYTRALNHRSICNKKDAYNSIVFLSVLDSEPSTYLLMPWI